MKDQFTVGNTPVTVEIENPYHVWVLEYARLRALEKIVDEDPGNWFTCQALESTIIHEAQLFNALTGYELECALYHKEKTK